MLNYTTVPSVYAAFPLIGSVTTITSAVCARVARNAESIMDAKLAKVFTVPVTGMPPVLETIANDLTLYRLLALRMFTQEQANESVWPDRYKEAMELLQEIIDGELTLVDSGGTPITPSVAAGQFQSSTMNYLQTMDELDATRQELDPDKETALLEQKILGPR